jgi:hypothetical protein
MPENSNVNKRLEGASRLLEQDQSDSWVMLRISIEMKLTTHSHFRLLHCFDHETVIMREVKYTSTLSRRYKFSQCIISTK